MRHSRPSPPQNGRTTLTLRIRTEMAKALRELANSGHRSLSGTVLDLVQDTLSFHELPGPVQNALRADLEAIGAAGYRDYLRYLLLRRYELVGAKGPGFDHPQQRLSSATG